MFNTLLLLLYGSVLRPPAYMGVPIGVPIGVCVRTPTSAAGWCWGILTQDYLEVIFDIKLA